MRKLSDAMWRLNNPEKVAAGHKLRGAVRRGLIVRKPCRICGKKADAHHDDYSKPLSVTWLCPYHHHARHRALRA